MEPYYNNNYDSFEYDPEYDTRTSSKYGRSRIGLIAGIILFFLGVVLIGLTLGDMDRGIYNNNRGSSGSETLIWTENPYWPTYGKGLWVGLAIIAVSILGILSHFEETHTAIKVFGISSLVSVVLLFYLIISTIKEIEFGMHAINTPNYYSWAIYNTFALNCALAGIASFTILVALIAGFLALAHTGLFYDTRYESVKPTLYR